LVSIEEARRQVEEISQKIEGLSSAYHETMQFNRLLSGTLLIVRRVSGSEDLNRFVTTLQRGEAAAMSFARTAQLAMAASGPFGWAMLGISAVTTVILTADLVNSYEVSGH
jgi:hypothetical protein